MEKIDENDLMYIYEWIDSLPLSKTKKNISRDFCDGCLLAEVIKHYYPKMVDMHNYPPASSSNQKCYNWITLNTKVLKKLGVPLSQTEINDVISCKSMAIEHVLQKVHSAIEAKTGKKLNNKNKSSPDQIAALKAAIRQKRDEKSQIQQDIATFQNRLQSLIDYKVDLESKINDLNQQLKE